MILPMSTAPRASWLARLAVIGASLVVYVIALIAPAINFEDTSKDPWPGMMAFIMGAFAVFEGHFAWLANPIYGIALLLLLFRQWIAAALVAALAVAVALSSFAVLGETAPLDEAGVNKAVVASLGPGFYAWLASMLTVAVGALALRFYEQAQAHRSRSQ